MSRTKIVCTIGPASRTPETIRAMIQEGLSVARLNFSHGDHGQHRENIEMIREAAKEMNSPVAILQDLSGPKIRVGAFEQGEIQLQDGDRFVLTTREVTGTQHEVQVNHPDLPRDLKPKDLLLLGDGALEFEVVETTETDVVCKVVIGGILGSNKGINSPMSSLSVRSLTDKDLDDLAFGLEHDVDYVALSFVRRASDIEEVKAFMQARGKDVPVIAKIEKHEAIKNIDEIMAAADGIMVARGDLGLEIPLQEVPMMQKFLITKANDAGKPVITATQMLGSMVSHPRPTRAEVTDVSNALLDGTDAIMLSEETAMGQYPVRTIRTMVSICNHTELEFPYEMWMDRYEVTREETIPEAISHSACTIAEKLSAPVIMVYSQLGASARMVSKFRPHARVLAITPVERAYRQLNLIWGVVPVLIEELQSTDETVSLSEQIARQSSRIHEGDRYVITGGLPIGDSGTTNTITVATLEPARSTRVRIN